MQTQHSPQPGSSWGPWRIAVSRSRTASRRGSREIYAKRAGRLLERQENVPHPIAVALLLDVGDLAAAAIGDARLRDLGRIDRVLALDVLRPHDAGDDQLAYFVVHPDFLPALDDEIAVGQHLGDDGGNVGQQRF